LDFRSAPDDIFGPWALECSRLDGVLSVLQRTDLAALGQRPGDEAAPPYTVTDGVATIPLKGMISKEPSWLQMIFGGTALASAHAQLQAALTDPAVAGILLHVFSPGGSVWGVDDFAAVVKEANKVKPVYAYIDDLGASSAYWAICGASSIWINASGFASGSGCYHVLVDSSKEAEQLGRAYEVISSGGVKGQGKPGVPVTDEYRDEIQRRVNDVTGRFIEAIAWRMPIAKARELRDGRLWMGEQAKEKGLVDQVGTIQGARRALRKEAKSMSEMKASATELETVKASLEAVTQERDTLTGRVADLERRLAPPVPADPIQALLASASPEQRAALERMQAEAAAAEVLRGQTRLAGFVAKAQEIGAGSKLPIKADALGGILMRAEDGKLTVDDRAELERLLRAGAASSPVQKPVGSSQDSSAGASAYAQATELARVKVAEGKAKSIHAAIQDVWAERPELWKQYEQERA
jgi:signal peptide peptidase SppA